MHEFLIYFPFFPTRSGYGIGHFFCEMESSTEIGDSLFSSNSLGAYTIKRVFSLPVIKRNLRLTLELLFMHAHFLM